MNKAVLAAAILFVLAAPAALDGDAQAQLLKKIHFTDTVTSSDDPGMGKSGQQMALLISPNPQSILVGSLTYAASSPVQAMVLHEISPGQSRGQPVWSVDGETEYAVSVISAPEHAGSADFVGAAVALVSKDGQEFSATASVDAWVRGKPLQVIKQTVQVSTAREEPQIRLSRPVAAVDVPLRAGLYNGSALLYAATDSSDMQAAEALAGSWTVQHAPSLADVPKGALGTAYFFKNGVKGDGAYGFQDEVFSATPSRGEYSGLWSASEITWKTGQSASLLESYEQIIDAKDGGRISVKETEAVLNMPHISWPGGQIATNATAALSDYEADPYGLGAQATVISEENMTATLIAHRGWGSEGRTEYCIPTGATPSGPARLMGAASVPAISALIESPAAADHFVFQNGLRGPGLLGFQPFVSTASPGDETYSPIKRVSVVKWADPASAAVLETKGDLDAAHEAELVSVSLARPLNSDYVINCPAVDPFGVKPKN